MDWLTVDNISANAGSTELWSKIELMYMKIELITIVLFCHLLSVSADQHAVRISNSNDEK